ncbi:MAG: alpha/beta fold hydrolase [Nocardioides sp.]|uniref:alpha/beta fold hydrolase n=1 Tax=Nocardioides sp. TaxID=35761 RepID=UPI003F0D2168
MDLIPKPEQVLAAAGNVAHKLLYGGIADLRPMPRTLIDAGELREVHHYLPDPDVPPTGDPVLLVTPLAAPALCFDLRRGCSLVEHLVSLGRPTYVVDYGQVSFANRSLGMEHWVEEVLPTAIRSVREHSGGRPVHVAGWSLGGIFALLTAADSPDLPIASITAIGSPVDVSKVPLMAPVRPLLNLGLGDLVPGGGVVTRAYRAMGGIPVPLVGAGFALASVHKLVTKPLVVATHLDDTDLLAQLEAVEAFMDGMHAYPGRSFGQLYHRFVKGNDLQDGRMELGGRTIDLAAVRAPTLVLAGNTDGIAPVGAVRPVTDLLTGAREVQFEIVPGGHLGMLTGRAARGSTWTVLDDWFARWSEAPKPRPRPRRRPSRDTIGSNPRRHSSAASRHLADGKASPRTP